ncbi:MAG TPA: hypothetical protein VLR88_05700 [Propionibacteriaceae bacterium]|nr:hypothetical protein [Propionibacteriaceae bacterium]
MRQFDRIDAVLDEFYILWSPSGDPVLDAIRAAVFVEDAFGVTLTDREMDPTHLGSRAAVRATVSAHAVT